MSALNIYSQNRYALVVGISDYPSSSGWHSISGANDIDIIVPLLYNNHFEKEHIATLKNAQATKSAIIDEIETLTHKVKCGDIVYFHFSGHGQLITDLNGDEGDYGFDEAIIPYDAKKTYQEGVYTGERHIVDDELNALLWGIKHKLGPEGRLVVVLDACHSGGGSRDVTDKQTCRGSKDIFHIPQQGKCPHNNINSHSIGWVCISACKSIQSNYEYQSPQGKRYGRLSWAIRNVLNGQLTPLQLIESIETQYDHMHSRYPQDPILDCDNKLYSVPIM